MTSRCVAYQCPQEALPGGQLCPTHQRRLDQGGGLPTPTRDDTSHGVFGILDIDETGVRCDECGQRFANLPIHLHRTHAMDADEYTARHGVRPAAMPPHPDGTPRRKPRTCPRCQTIYTTHGKICPTCRAQREQDIQQRRRNRPRRRPRWRPLTDNEIDELKAATTDELPSLVARLQQDRVGSNRIAKVLGIRRQLMSELFPRPDRNQQS